MEQTNNNFIPEVELGEQIPDDKFDKHMQNARKSTIKARQKIFTTQNEGSANRKVRYTNIKPSVY
jgi:hypothetical protein